jgi:hypothetical protein
MELLPECPTPILIMAVLMVFCKARFECMTLWSLLNKCGVERRKKVPARREREHSENAPPRIRLR